MARWLLVQSDSGRITVTRDRRRHSEHGDLGAATSAIADEVTARDRVTLEEPDGYRSIITRNVGPRRGWRR